MSVTADPYQFQFLTGTDYVDLTTANPVLVVIDMQRAFVSLNACYEVPGGRAIVPNVNRLVQVARKVGVPVVWVQADYTPPIGGLTVRKFPEIREKQSLWRGSADFELDDEVIRPRDDEFRIVKHTYDAFYHTELEWFLRTHQRDAVIIVGVASDVCCDTTVRSAYCRGFLAAMVSDASAAAAGADFHVLALRTIDTYFARVMPTEAVVTELTARLHSL